MSNEARGLHLPEGSLGPSLSQQHQIQQVWDTIGEVEKELAQRGLIPMNPPPFAYPGFITPDQLTQALNADYTTLYAQHLAWYNYTAQLLARVKAFLLGVANEMTDIETTIRKDLRDKNRELEREKKYSIDDIKDAVQLNDRYRSLAIRQQQFEQNKIEIDSHLDCMDRNLKVISRQVEIRRVEQEADRTESAMPHRGREVRYRG